MGKTNRRHTEEPAWKWERTSLGNERTLNPEGTDSLRGRGVCHTTLAKQPGMLEYFRAFRMNENSLPTARVMIKYVCM